MLLELSDVHVHYGKVEALKGVSLTVDEGEIVTLVGGNGAGKSTTLKTISGLRPVTCGSIRFEGEDIVGVPAHRLVQRGLSQAPEGRGIFPGMTVMENLEMGAYACTGAEPGPRPTSTVSSSCFPGWPNAAFSPAARSPPESSRCWPSGGR
jgi:branched-chain amino acid transport system ATP-binding protein